MNDFYMEDVQNLSSDVTQHIQNELEKFDIVLNSSKEDKLFEEISGIIERFCINDYRSYN